MYFPSFSKGLSVLGLFCDIHLGSLKFCFNFTSCLYRASRSTRSEILGPSLIFPGHVYTSAFAWFCRFPGICWEFFKVLVNILVLALLLSFLQTTVSPSYYPLPQAVMPLKQLPVNIFFKCQFSSSF